MTSFNSIVILGPTASGKTRLAAHLAFKLQGAVLSFDSRQVYKQLTIGTGKDLAEFNIHGSIVPSYLIDVCDINTNFHSYEFVKNYIAAFENCMKSKQIPVLCGGTGLYLDLALKKHQYISIPINETLRIECESLPDETLINTLNSFATAYTKQVDRSTRKRMVRAIEIADYLTHDVHEKIPYPELKPIIFGMKLSPTERKLKINQRLEERLTSGLIEEVEHLLEGGISKERLIFLGLEYKFVTEFVTGKYDKSTMVKNLQIAIQQYAKRQMTWFRKMEREGNKIHWIDGNLNVEAQMDIIYSVLKGCSCLLSEAL